MSETPHSHRRSNKFIGYLILGAALLFIFGGLGWYNYKAFFANSGHLETDSADCLAVRALITDRAKPSGYKNSGAVLSYRYEVAGKAYEQREDVDESTYYLNLNNDSISVCAHRDDPARANITGNEEATVSQIKIIMIDVVMAVVVLLVVLQARKISRQSKN